LEGLTVEDVGIFYWHLYYFMAIWYILWPFGIFCGNLVYFPPFWYFGPRKIWQPWIEAVPAISVTGNVCKHRNVPKSSNIEPSLEMKRINIIIFNCWRFDKSNIIIFYIIIY
jgi:hypothetical protein